MPVIRIATGMAIVNVTQWQVILAMPGFAVHPRLVLHSAMNVVRMMMAVGERLAAHATLPMAKFVTIINAGH